MPELVFPVVTYVFAVLILFRIVEGEPPPIASRVCECDFSSQECPTVKDFEFIDKKSSASGARAIKKSITKPQR